MARDVPTGRWAAALAAAALVPFLAAPGSPAAPAFDPSPVEHVLVGGESFGSGDGVLGRLHRIKRPVLVTDGRKDIVVPPGNSRLIAGRIPDRGCGSSATPDTRS
jgi:pimeloyl-ACP methyl ester carboxylesterase